MEHLFAVIMAGGSGTRFWPLSRRDHPKQFLQFDAEEGGHSLLQATIERVASIIPRERILIVTSKQLETLTREHLPGIPAQNILIEPVGRNTAPCVGWAAAHAARHDPDAILAVFPADHYITNVKGFAHTIERCMEAARNQELVTIGIEPSRPETGYGYIEVGGEIEPDVFRARRFVEKPNHQRAQQFLLSKRYWWNSGIFLFRADVIRAAIDQHLPGLAAALNQFDEAAKKGNEMQVVEQLYPTLPAISIDHGIMEKVEHVCVVRAAFSWSDLGSWMSAWELALKDEANNALLCQNVVFDAHRNYVRASNPDKVVAIIGMDDLVVVDTPDALLIVPKHRAQEVRDVISVLNQQKSKQL